MVKHSATLAINEKIAARKIKGLSTIHLGFGEAGLPVPGDVIQALTDAADHNAYAPVTGTEEACEAAAGYFTRRGMATDANQIIFAPGSKALLYAALAALPGDLILPCPAWVTYAAQAELTGKHVISVPAPEEAGGIPDPEQLEQAITTAQAAGSNPRILLVTLPDNPTGTLAGHDRIRQLCNIAQQYDLTLISDEIYRDLVHDDATTVLSPATLLPEQTIVTSGLSKNMALGGWRIGFARLPDGAPGQRIKSDMIGIASEVWSSLPGPMQAVAAHVLSEPESVVHHIDHARRLHATVAGAVARIFIESGAVCRPPTAAFYCYPDFEPLRSILEAKGIKGSIALADTLLDKHGVAVLAGEHFGDNPEAYRCRVASSLLYGGTTEQRWQALQSAEPLELPWIADTLSRLQAALEQLKTAP